MLRLRENSGSTLAVALAVAAALYIVWKITQSPEQALQFTFNGLAVGAVYALIAIGFTLVYSTVWFFDLYYGAAAALGAYGVFYLRSFDTLGGRYEVNEPVVNIVFAAVTAGVAAWAFHEALRSRFRRRDASRNAVRIADGAVAVVAGIYMWLVLTFPAQMHFILSPAVGAVVAAGVYWLIRLCYRKAFSDAGATPVQVVGAVVGIGLGAYCALLISGSARVGTLSQLGRIVLAGGRRGTGAVQRAVHAHARAREVAAGDAGRYTGHIAGDDRVDYHRVSERAAPAARIPSAASRGISPERTSRGSMSSLSASRWRHSSRCWLS